MCFSASASFTASALLSFLGALAITQARTRQFQFFAATPLLFAVQQACEGVLWLTLGTVHTALAQATMYIFLCFAMMVWPVWIPGTLIGLETNNKRKRLLYACLAAGITFAAYAGYYLLRNGAVASIAEQHVAYTSYPVVPALYIVAQSIYAIALLLPCFISSVQRIWLLGVLAFGSAVVSHIWYQHHFASVWCFFAAVLSSVILYIVMFNNKKSGAL